MPPRVRRQASFHNDESDPNEVAIALGSRVVTTTSRGGFQFDAIQELITFVNTATFDSRPTHVSEVTIWCWMHSFSCFQSMMRHGIVDMSTLALLRDDFNAGGMREQRAYAAVDELDINQAASLKLVAQLRQLTNDECKIVVAKCREFEQKYKMAFDADAAERAAAMRRKLEEEAERRQKAVIACFVMLVLFFFLVSFATFESDRHSNYNTNRYSSSSSSRYNSRY